MRLVHLPSSYIPETLGGTEVYVETLVAGLREQGHESVVAWHTSGSQLLSTDARPLPPLSAPSRAALRAKERGLPPPGFGELLDDFCPDLVHFHAFTLGASVDHARLALDRGIPYVVTFHTPAMSCARGTWMLRGKELCDGRLDARRCAECVLESQGWSRLHAELLALSPLPFDELPEGPWTTRFALPSLLRHSFEKWRGFFADAAHVVAPAVSVESRMVTAGLATKRLSVLRQALPGATRQRSLRFPPRESGRPLKLGFFGRVTPVKGPDVLVDALPHLRTAGIVATVELAGPIAESERGWVDDLLARGGAATRYVGVHRGEALASWLSTLDLVVLPSRWFETGPLTLLEAWDAEVPVLGTDQGGMAEFMSGAGLSDLLFPVGDSAGLAKAVARALDHDGRSHRVSVPGVEELVRAMVEIYMQCVAGDTAAGRC